MMTAHVSTLLQAIESHAVKKPKNSAVTFDNDLPLSYENLQIGIVKMATLLIEKEMKPQDRVIIAIPNSIEFFFAFYGVLKAGGIAVPVSPGSQSKRMMKFAHACDAAFILTSQRFPNDANQITPKDRKRPSSESLIKLTNVEDSFTIIPDSSFPAINPDNVAFIQFTSGTTGDSKGVQISHSDLITNMNQMIQGMQITKDDIFVSWLPVFHDMGLILMTMVPLLLGRHFFLLSIGFKHLKAWLNIIQNHKATFTAAPDFMYRLTMAYIKDPENYDLSSLRTALNAAEPVRSTTIEQFEIKFSLKNVLVPAYGLAEATVGVCCWHPGKPVKIDKKGHVSVGKPFPGVKVKIGMENIPGADKGVGEILVHSPAKTRGYYKNPEADRRLFTRDNYIRTGDMGYLDENGDLTVVGRKKNIIIQGGINISSREVEELVDSFPFIRRSAAVGIDRGKLEGEQVYIFTEVKFSDSQWADPDFLEGKTIDMVQVFYTYFGFRPGRILLLKPRTIPTTQNGKTQYSKLIEQYFSNALES